MSGVADCSTSTFAGIDQLGAPMSLPAEPHSRPGEPARLDEPAGGDTFEQAPTGGPFDSLNALFTDGDTPRRAAARYGPGVPPEPPLSPRERDATVVPTGLSGAELERALSHNEQCWRDYASSYREYLEGYRAAFAGCRSLDQLRDLQPEPPDEAMALVGDERGYENLDRQLRSLHGEKVDRGYELIGETSPGTLILMLKGSVKLLGVGAEVEFSADSKGHTGVETKATAESPLVKLELNDKGEFDAKLGLELAGYGGKVSRKGGELKAAKLGELAKHAKAEFDLESGKLTLDGEVVPGLGAKASYDAGEAKYGGGITVGRALTTPAGTTLMEAKGEAELLLKGMSKEDVKRALDGWLVPDRFRRGAPTD